jgi:hypothetical protein
VLAQLEVPSGRGSVTGAAELLDRGRHAEMAETVRRDVRDLRPRDMIDLQSFIWVQGSDEYEE